MAEDPTHGLLIISAVAVAAPICAELAKRLRVPSVLFELLLAAGSVGEFGPIVAITVLVGAGDPTNQFLVLGLFFALVVGLLFLATRHQPPKVVAALQRQLHSSTQLPIRLVLFFVVAMSALAVRLGIDLLLGAFAAGMVIRLGIAEGLEPKLDAVGYGFFIPIFFIVSGIGMDAHFFTTLGALRIPIFCGLFLVVRGIPALFIYRRDLDRRSRWGFAVLQSTALPLLVVLTQIGLDTHTMLPVNASAIVAAGMLSVLAFPLIGFSLITAERALVDAGVVAPAS